MSVINYSKWDHIEISDDEHETHPNVDTQSLFKWRHEARIQRKADEKRDKQRKEAESKLRKMKIDGLRAQRSAMEKSGASGPEAEAKLSALDKEIEATIASEKDFQEKEAELEAYQKAHPKWDVDNISKDKHSRTVINKAGKGEPGEMELTAYFQKYESELQAFGMLKEPKAAQQYLMEHMHLVCDHLASYLTVWCSDLATEGKFDQMETVSRQCICAQFIMELAKSMKQDPRACVNAFYARMIAGDLSHKQAFTDELTAFRARVRTRAKERIAEAEQQVADEERAARLGPGGLDPLEVMESLPEKMQRGFKEQNTPLLMEAAQELGEDFGYHWDRCIKSGLWVPAEGEAGAKDEEEEEKEEEKEEEE